MLSKPRGYFTGCIGSIVEALEGGIGIGFSDYLQRFHPIN